MLSVLKEKLEDLPPENAPILKDAFLKISNHDDLAVFLGVTYAELSDIIYKTSDWYKYHQFEIPKKTGGQRKIFSPNKKLKGIQRQLKDVFYEIYPTKISVHGFAQKRSIITNAEKHLDKKFIFNLDLEDFFGSIHFGRIRNLFKSRPFNFNNSVSTILAQTCCFNNSLPQGAPTSPILSNMIAWKMDSQLQRLAKLSNATYTRYADDISFSFTVKKKKLPREIIIMKDGEVEPGETLASIIENNGFAINYSKTRLCSNLSRMEVTGLTVNQFPNVKRQYIRQISSMLNAWRKYGYKAAAEEYNVKYNKKGRASGKQKSYQHVVKGKLAFLRSVRSSRDPIFIKLAKQFNALVDDKYKFKIRENTDPEQNAIDALWVIEACYDDEKGELCLNQGTAFQLENIGIVTCAHVVSNDEKIYENIEVYKYNAEHKKYKIDVERICHHRDVAICSIKLGGDDPPKETYIKKSTKAVEMQEDVKLLGFPGYAPGQGYFMVDSKVARIYPQGGLKQFEISNQIRQGNSGGPVLNEESEVVGIAIKGASMDSGNNGCLVISEIDQVVNSDEYLI